MPARSRVKDERIPQLGTCWFLPGNELVAMQSATNGKKTWCEDVVGNFGGNNPLQIDIRDSHWPILNGVFLHPDAGIPWFGYYDYPCGQYSVEAANPAELFPMLDIGDLSNLAWELLSKANPNVPAVNIPQYVAELKDIPSLVKGWGDSILKDIAKGVISWRWAIKPLHRDLKTLEKFMNELQQRIDWLNKLRKDKTLRRKVSLGSERLGPGKLWGEWPLDSLTQGSRLTVSETQYTHMKMWGTANFKLADSAVLPPPGRISDRRFATKWMTGLNSAGALAAAWELCPWSWMTDWFLGVGTVINATNNTVPLTWGHLSIMRHTESVKILEVVRKPAEISIKNSFRSTWTRKERYPAFPLLPFTSYLPVADAGKWSILASLAALRLLPGRKRNDFEYRWI
jgi:hypothetical protein